MLYIIKNRMPLGVKLQYIKKSIKRGFIESESDFDNEYKQRYDEITLDYLKKFHPEEYKTALERLSFVDSDNNTLRHLLGSIIYGGVKSIYLFTIVTPITLVHHAISESVYLFSNVLNFFVNAIKKFFVTFSTQQKPEKSILLNNEVNYISRAKKIIRDNQINDRHISFELSESESTNYDATKHRVKSSEDKRRIKGMLYRMRLMLDHGKRASLESMQEEDMTPTLQQYRESHQSSWASPLTGSDSLILAGRIGWKI